MFERRLKIFFALLIAMALLLLLRAGHVQVVNADYWRDKAAESLKRYHLIDTIRGGILDVRGRPLAVDEPSIDAAVDYRAIVREPAWMRAQALDRLKATRWPEYRAAGKAGRERMIEEETGRLKQDLDELWRTLAALSGRPIEEIEQIKASIRRRVEMRRRYLWYKKYEQAIQRHGQRAPEPWYKQWLIDEEPAPELDSFAIDVAEQTESHVILSAISTETHNRLKKNIERYPGLELRTSKHRYYPYGAAACHVLGHLGAVTREDLQADPNPDNELRQYYPNDSIGRGGIEALAEQALRGSRGRIERVLGQEGVRSSIGAEPGQDVRITLDIELQLQIEEGFKRVEWKEKEAVVEAHEMHGAAVVIDIPTGEVRALVSYPTYDLNHFDELYPLLAADDTNFPLLNRATQMALEPGSTVKPMVGLGAITQGLIGPHGTIECTGYLVVDGHKQLTGRCWVASKFLAQLGPTGLAHHPVPWSDPHPTGHLTLADAIQRSCNVYFEMLGDRLGLDGLSYWFERFGLGRRTGIGLPEVTGRLPNSYRGPASQYRSTKWFCAIGQSQILATPIQMANVAATIARDGVWMRPRLFVSGLEPPRATTRPADDNRPDVLNLKISPAALATAREGMSRVVNTRSGTGYEIHRSDVLVAGKTGTAQAANFSIIRRDEKGLPVRDDRGRIVRDYPPISTRQKPNPRMPWYRGSGSSGADLSHAWFIGFAPAKDPQIAFAVAMEFGGSGGHDAAPIVNALLDACIEHGYLRK